MKQATNLFSAPADFTAEFCHSRTLDASAKLSQAGCENGHHGFVILTTEIDGLVQVALDVQQLGDNKFVVSPLIFVVFSSSLYLPFTAENPK